MRFRHGLLSATALSFAFGATSLAAELKYDNNSGGHVRLYGQFSPAIQSVDDGIESKDTLVDNAHSNSRVGLWVVQPYDQGEFTFNFETALGFRQSDGVTINTSPDAFSWRRTNLRKIDFAFGNDSWGKIYAGQGSMASDGVADISLNNNSMTTYNGIPDFAGSFEFRTPDGGSSGVSISSVFSSLDGGRRGRVRYDSPSFNGFQVALAAGQEVLSDTNSDNYYDIALKYGGEFNGTEVKGGLGFSRRDRDSGGNVDDTFGSVAVKLPSGFNFALSAGSRKDDGSYTYGLIGYEAEFWSIGTTSFALDYYNGSDFGLDGRDSKAMGIGVNQNIDSINTQVYLGYRNHELSDPGVAYEDIAAFLFGARWRF